MTKASKNKKGDWRKKASKIMKQTKGSLVKSGQHISKYRSKTSDWIVKNINPDVYDLGVDIDPWNPFGSSKKKKRR